MNISYEGIGQWAATFACTDVSEGQVVKVSGSGTVAACAADGDGGVSVVSTGGKSYLAVDVDTSAKTVTIVL